MMASFSKYNVQTDTEMAKLNFDEFIDNVQICDENATNDSVKYLFLVSARRVSRHAGTDVTDSLARHAGWLATRGWTLDVISY